MASTFETLIVTPSREYPPNPFLKEGMTLSLYRNSILREDGDNFFPRAYPSEQLADIPQIRQLDDCFIGFFAPSAGAGHKHPAHEAVFAQKSNDIWRAYPDTVTTEYHEKGSEGLGQVLGELIGRYRDAQTLWERLHRIKLKKAGKQSVLAHGWEMMSEAKRQGKQYAVFVCTHADPAILLGENRRKLESQFGNTVKVITVLVMADHFMDSHQYAWEQFGPDVIIAPDPRTMEVTIDGLVERSKFYLRDPRKSHQFRFPWVLYNEFLTNPAFANKLPKHIYEGRLRRLMGTENGIRISIPFGGSAPGKKDIRSLMKNLKNSPEYASAQITTILKDKTGNPAFNDYITEMEGLNADIRLVSCDDALVDEYERNILTDGTTPDLILTKPSQISNWASFSPDEYGGGIMLFMPPVGSQEKENLKYLQSRSGGNVLFMPQEQEELFNLLIEKEKAENHLKAIRRNHTTKWEKARSEREAIRQQLEPYMEKAQSKRGIILPYIDLTDGKRKLEVEKAALMLKLFKKYGVFDAMAKYKRPESENRRVKGSLDFWPLLGHAVDVVKQYKTFPYRDIVMRQRREFIGVLPDMIRMIDLRSWRKDLRILTQIARMLTAVRKYAANDDIYEMMRSALEESGMSLKLNDEEIRELLDEFRRQNQEAGSRWENGGTGIPAEGVVFTGN